MSNTRRNKRELARAKTKDVNNKIMKRYFDMEAKFKAMSLEEMKEYNDNNKMSSTDTKAFLDVFQTHMRKVIEQKAKEIVDNKPEEVSIPFINTTEELEQPQGSTETTDTTSITTISDAEIIEENE
jgi:hypothetical protein